MLVICMISVRVTGRSLCSRCVFVVYYLIARIRVASVLVPSPPVAGAAVLAKVAERGLTDFDRVVLVSSLLGYVFLVEGASLGVGSVADLRKHAVLLGWE